ncbi:MAG: preprotein translocase subunit SecY [bacterium]|nr:preprotein translocase subunit SecY [bacterium]
MSLLRNILTNLPEVQKPTQKRLSFKEKLKWTGIVLIIFYILGLIPLFKLGENGLLQFEFLSMILGAEFGSIISLGIGPIVTASIILQLLNGAGILKFDLTSHEGKMMFQGTQKAASIFFILLEAVIYVFAGGLKPEAGTSEWVLIFQLALGGLLILFMDEVVSKWGFGSGIGLFIAAGVSKSLIVQLLSPFTGVNPVTGEPSVLYFLSETGQAPVGKLLEIFHALPQGHTETVLLAVFAIITTIIVFCIAVYTQAMKIEVPLSFGRIRGHGIRWPLSFIYTGVIPVILIAALMANIKLWVGLLQGRGITFLGTFDQYGKATSGFVEWISPPNLLELIVKGQFQPIDLAHAAVYMLFMIAGAVVFSVFWVQTANMDARAQAKNMMSSGLQIPGFRRDERVLESLLNRYIPPLTIMGAITIGFLASIADISGALTSGTGLLLTVMIIFRLYEEIAQQHAMDMNPMLRRFMG